MTADDPDIHNGKENFGIPPSPQETGQAFRKLCDVVAQLRAPGGCPWDREQTLESIKPHTLEETYELLEAIDSGNDADIVEELGDLLLQVILDAQIGKDEHRFDLVDVIQTVTRKLIQRHPHVFGDTQAHTAEDVLKNWEREKAKEKKRDSILEGIAIALPQLARTVKLSKRAAKVGYDWPVREMLFDKLQEELQELLNELYEDGRLPNLKAGVDEEVVPDIPIEDEDRLKRAEGEIGDMLFVIANIARRWGINPEEALRKTNQKFSRRFQAIENNLRDRGMEWESVSLQEMEAIYQAYKLTESSGNSPANSYQQPD